MIAILWCLCLTGASSMYMDLGVCLWAPVSLSLFRKRSQSVKALNAEPKSTYSIVPSAATVSPGRECNFSSKL
uniref:APS reductase 3 n=1 Tax=Tanacetum cinerariifolium TaxID=118510 RepID=A0A6L2KET7_TANCI|nr:APS reductase 3 [Tanacetum cinerariifolium]